MSLRRGVLIAMLVALALCAGMGVLVVFTGSDELLVRLLSTAIDTAVASAILLGLTFLVGMPKLRVGGLAGMGVILFAWLLVFGLIWTERWAFGVADYRLQECLAMTLGFSLLMGLPGAIVLCLSSFRWAGAAIRIFIAGAVLAFLICEVGALFELLDIGYPIGEWPFEIGMLTYALATVIAMLAVNADCGDRRYFRWPAAVVALLGWGLAVSAVVRTSRESMPWTGVILGTAWITAIILAHTNLVLMARLRRWQLPVQWATMALAWLCGICAVVAIVQDSGLLGGRDFGLVEATARAAAGTGIVAGCGSLALVVLSIFNIMLKSQRAEVGGKGPGAMQATAMEITCPRCQEKQTVRFGDSACKSCDLRFSIKVTEPRCPACGYLLYQLTSARCPECGADLQNGQTGPVVGPAFPVQPAGELSG